MIVVNFSTEVYKNAQTRLANSIAGQAFSCMFTKYKDINSPTHQQSPYEFKIHAIEEAAEIDPIVLWCDSSMWRVGDLSIIKNYIKRDGYFMEEAGHYAGRWTNKHTRQYFQVTEEEMYQGAGGITLFSAGLLGLDFKNPLAVGFFKMWKDAALAGCFSGSWEDHRHDMTCASIIATRLGMKYHRGGSHMAYIGPGYAKPAPDVVFYCQGLL